MLADRDVAVRDVAAVVAFHRRGQQLVELGDRFDVRDGDEMTTPEPADLGLHATLLVAPFDARLAEEAVEPVVRSQRDEPFRLDAGAALQHLRDRRLQIVVADPVRHPTEVLEAAHVPVEEYGLALIQVRAGEAFARRRQS